jgi:hypothetical protein
MGLSAALLVGCGGADAAIPVGYVDKVQSARDSLMSEDDDPTSSFAFLRVRCRDDGGTLVEFEQSSLFSGSSYAYAMQGPGAISWGGGLRARDLAADPEIEYFFSDAREVPCVER